MRTAIMFLGNLLAPAYARVETLRNDVGQPIVDDDLDLECLDSSAGTFPASATGPIQSHGRRPLIRTVPAGFSLSSLTAASSASISSSRGATVCSRRSPASVSETLRVVRVRSRMPSRASS